MVARALRAFVASRWAPWVLPGRGRRRARAGHPGRRRPVPDGRPQGLHRRHRAPDRRHALRLLLRAAAPAVHLPGVLRAAVRPGRLAELDGAPDPVAAGQRRGGGLPGLRHPAAARPGRPGIARSIRQPTGMVVSVTGGRRSGWSRSGRRSTTARSICSWLPCCWPARSARRTWWQGTTVGLAAGIKLVPAITGLYYLLQRRFAAVVWAVGIFAATVRCRWRSCPAQTWRYFTELIFDPGRTGPVWSAINQSWRGALARLAGHEVTASGRSPACSPWRWACGRRWAVPAGRRPDGGVPGGPVGRAVGLADLLVAPLGVGAAGAASGRSPDRARRSWAARGVAIGWLVGCYSYLVPILIVAQGPGTPPASRPGWQSWLGTVYVVLGMATLLVMACCWPGRRSGCRSTGWPTTAGGRRAT